LTKKINMERYEIRLTRDKRSTNLQTILRRHSIKQNLLAQEADMENWQVSEMCTGRANDMLLSTAKRLCNALNDLIINENIEYTIHDIFGD